MIDTASKASVAVSSHYTPEIGRWEQTRCPDRAHNEILDTLVSAGVIGASIEIALFAAILLGAARTAMPRCRQALQRRWPRTLSRSVRHRGCGEPARVFAVAAVVAGARTAGADESRPITARSVWIAAAAGVGALSPWLSTLPSVINNPITTGTEDQFIAYLASQAISTPWLYAALLLLAIVMAWSLAGGGRTAAWWQLPALGAAVRLVVPLSIAPSRADVQRRGQPIRPRSALARSDDRVRAAAREAPTVPEYHDGPAAPHRVGAWRFDARDRCWRKHDHERAIASTSATRFTRATRVLFGVRASFRRRRARRSADRSRSNLCAGHGLGSDADATVG